MGFNLGYIEPDEYGAGDLVVNGVAIDAVAVEPGDSSGTLCAFFNSVDGVSAVNTNGEVTLEFEGKLTVDGVSVNGICGGIQNIHVGEMGD